MTHTDIIVLIILFLIICGAAFYIYKAKKNGAKCIGCPSGCNCSHSKDGNHSCNCDCGK